jgi:hypothetical protein
MPGRTGGPARRAHHTTGTAPAGPRNQHKTDRHPPGTRRTADTSPPDLYTPAGCIRLSHADLSPHTEPGDMRATISASEAPFQRSRIDMISYQNNGKYSTADSRKTEIVSKYSNAWIDLRHDNARNSAYAVGWLRSGRSWRARLTCSAGLGLLTLIGSALAQLPAQRRTIQLPDARAHSPKRYRRSSRRPPAKPRRR